MLEKAEKLLDSLQFLVDLATKLVARELDEAAQPVALVGAEKLLGGVKLVTDEGRPVEVPADPPVRRTRKAKAEPQPAPAPAATPAQPVQSAADTLGLGPAKKLPTREEKEARVDETLSIARRFVEVFKNAVPPGLEQLQDIVHNIYKVDKIADISYDGLAELGKTLEEKMEAKGK